MGAHKIHINIVEFYDLLKSVVTTGMRDPLQKLKKYLKYMLLLGYKCITICIIQTLRKLK